MESSTVAFSEEIQRAIQALDFNRTRHVYWDQDECIFIESFLSLFRLRGEPWHPRPKPPGREAFHREGRHLSAKRDCSPGSDHDFASNPGGIASLSRLTHT